MPAEVSGYERLVVLFDGNDEDALAAARGHWKAVKAAGHEATYWQQDRARALGEEGLRLRLGTVAVRA